MTKDGARQGGKPPYAAREGRPFRQEKKAEDRRGARPPRTDGKRPDGSRPAGKGPYHRPRMEKPIQRGMAKPAPRDPNAPSSLSRRVALDIFEDVIRKDAYASLSLDERLRSVNLSQLDKRFCASIVYRTLENLIRIDYALSFFLKDADALEPKVRDILRISACQLLFHDRIPDNAIVDEAVKLTRGAGLEGLTGLTNAVLRNMIRGKDEIKWPDPNEGPQALSILYSVPLWLANKLTEAYGPDMAREICAYRSESHYTVIRPTLTRYTDEAFEALLQKKVWESEKGVVAHAYRVRMASDIGRDADYLAGNFSIQGESSMLAAQAVDVKRGSQVLDCCAAPGGKTAYLAEQMRGTGRVYAWDVHEHRVKLIQAQARRLKLDNIRPAVRDASVLKDDLAGMMDAVLLDAPCSGLGVMDNKPDIKIRATEEGLRELTALQEKLLNTCCQYVKKGGTLVYSTCSMLPEENKDQVKRFLESHPDFAIDPLPDGVGEAFQRAYTDCGLQLLPHRDGVEGFFIARMRRVK
ncbi:MAG: 16S rRNA (cytosine(967)-C(5))-methyltransferase RsmB [Clostridia bacterium]|nr:16S rRNA (cytosine(967)-C(5))-methyltransferase RsmB [Clostridia bacterium]